MKRMLRRFAVAAAVLTAAACQHHADLSKPATQDNFGVQMAKMNLWREAMFRFRRAVEINPSDALAHNNLAVAYEANGDFDSARKEYLEALKLDRNNAFIQKNYSRYVEFLSRNKKRQTTRTAGTSNPAPLLPKAGASGMTGVLGPPDRPEVTEKPKPLEPPAPPPVDLPPQPAPNPPPPKPPPGGAP